MSIIEVVSPKLTGRRLKNTENSELSIKEPLLLQTEETAVVLKLVTMKTLFAI